MAVTAIALAVFILLIVLHNKRKAKDRAIAGHMIMPEELHSLLDAKSKVQLFDLRLPLDFLVDAELIPGAERITPREVIANPSLIPKNEDTVVYCTCPGEKTSRKILRRFLAMGYSRVRLLQGGLAAWKAKGYPVELYQHSFHLDTAAS